MVSEYKGLYQITSGPLIGSEIEVEGTIMEVFGPESAYGCADFNSLLAEGRPVALIARQREGYTQKDEPLIYGKIGQLGHIVSAKQLQRIKK